MLLPFSGFNPHSDGGGFGGGTTANFTLSGNITDWNLIAELGSIPLLPMTVNITIDNTAIVSASGPTVAALDISGLQPGSTVNITNEGYVLGAGGRGGNGRGYNTTGNWDGGAGGTAVFGPSSGSTVNLTNASGNIWGGGGGGGGGGRWRYYLSSYGEWLIIGGHGGGGGAGSGSVGGTGGEGDNGVADDGGAGTGGISGAAGTASTTGLHLDGGDGGAYGVAGSAGQNGSGTGSAPGGAAGTAGHYINSNGATVNWVSGGTAPNVKGTAV